RRVAPLPARASASAAWSWCWSGSSATVPCEPGARASNKLAMIGAWRERRAYGQQHEQSEQGAALRRPEKRAGPMGGAAERDRRGAHDPAGRRRRVVGQGHHRPPDRLAAPVGSAIPGGAAPRASASATLAAAVA